MQISWYHCCGNNSFPYLFPSFKVVSVQPYVCDVVGSVQKRRPGLLLTVLLLLFCWKCCSILGHDGATMLKSWILKCKLCMCYVLTREPRGGWSKVVHRYRQLKTSGCFWECWWARAASSCSWRDRHFMKNLLFLSPNQPPTSLQQRFSSSCAQDIVTDFEPPECMNYTENQWTAFVKKRLLDISPYLCSADSTSRTWTPVFLYEDDFLLSFIQFCWLT